MIQDTPLATPGAMVGSTVDQPPAGNDPQWEPASPRHCYERKSNNTAWYDPCRQWYTLAKDGDPDRISWSHLQFGTAKSKGMWEMVKFEVKAWRKKGSADQDWQDWSPRADTDYGNCQTTTVGVNINAAYVEHSATQCEEWDVNKGSAPGDFANTWRGRVNRHERDVAAMKATSTPNGTYPINKVRYDYYAEG